jgi:hypothetical protein
LRISYKYVFHAIVLIITSNSPWQCSIPVFEHLLPDPHNEIVLDLLFTLCTWHALAKLRLHTSSTLQALKAITKALGHQLRYWVKKTCSAFDTRELPKEESARHRRKASAAAKPDKGGKVAMARSRGSRGRPARGGRGSTSTRSHANTSTMPNSSNMKASTQNRREETLSTHQSRVLKHFSMCTYKLHALGHYVAAIAWFGTTDNYSTQVVR